MKKFPKFPIFREPIEKYYLAAKEGKVLKLGIQLRTPPCNWNCPYCYAPTYSKETDESMKESNEQMKKWVLEGKKLGVYAVSINGQYEPSTNPYLLNFLEFCVDQGLNTQLVSNGSNLDIEKIRKLKSMKIPVLLKLNVPFSTKDNERYQEYNHIQSTLCGKSDSSNIYEEIMRKIDMFIDEGYNLGEKEGETRIGVESVITNLNLDCLMPLVRQLREKNIYGHFEVPKIQGQCKRNAEIIPSNQKIREFFEYVRQDDLKNGYEDWTPRPPFARGACFQNLIRLNICPDGKVMPCPAIEVICGDLKKESMEQIVKNSEVLKNIRNLESRITGPCSSCDLMSQRKCYGGCRGNAYQELTKKGTSLTEAILGSDPLCWKECKNQQNI